MKFTASHYKVTDEYSESFKAHSWKEAEKIAKEKGLVLDGRVYLTIPAFGSDIIPDLIMPLLGVVILVVELIEFVLYKIQDLS